MKRTDMLRKERELKKSQKKQDKIIRESGAELSVGDFINELSSLFFYDENKIYNIDSEEKILELLEEMKDTMDEKNWDNIIRKAVKKTKINDKETAVDQLKSLL